MAWAQGKDCHLALRSASNCSSSVLKNLPANAGDAGSIPGSERSSGGGHGNPFQYSCQENPHGQRNLEVTAHRSAKSQTQLKRLSI